MKFVHTADWHIGMKFSSFEPEQAERARRERLDAGRRVVELANRNNADFIVIAGDLFHDNAVERTLVTQTASILGKFAGRVFIIPGNHDPLVPGSVWDHAPSWKSYGNIEVFRESRPVELDSVVLYPCVPTAKYNSAEPTGWIDAASQPKISVGIAHGNVDILQTEARDTPIPVDVADRRGLDYLALGHWHSTIIYGKPGAERMAYCGTHERGSFGERDSGYALLVEIADRNSSPVITRHETGSLKWQKTEQEIRGQADMENVVNEISAMQNPELTVLSLTLTGFLFPGALDEMDRLAVEWKNRFMSFSLDNSQMRPSPDSNEWLENLPRGLIRDTAADLIEMSKGSDRKSRVALEALMDLYRMTHEVAK